MIRPEGYTLDAALLERPGNVEIQLDLFLDYASNVRLYPEFHAYFRKSKPPLLAIWGALDPYFIPAGAKRFNATFPTPKYDCCQQATSHWRPTSKRSSEA